MKTKPIESIIHKLGYDNSDKLYRLDDICKCKDLSSREKRILVELAPYAVYVVDGRVLVAFYEHIEETNIQNKLWNAQIPFVISDNGDNISIFNGRVLDTVPGQKIKLSNIAESNIDRCADIDDFNYWNITNSFSLKSHTDSLTEKNLNYFLINNLLYITKKLREEYQISFANKLMLRVLFIRYLIDRGINIGYPGLDGDVEKSQKNFLDIINRKSEFFKLLKYLKSRFNGNLFEINEATETKELTEDALLMLHDFLTGKEDMQTGQLCLFPFYDFNIIPIELISNIYEILLGKERQKKDKAFYTPEYLVDYIVERTVCNSLIAKNECKVLDPSCGSGVFLVKTLQKMLEKNANEDGFIDDVNLINKLVRNNIFGIDYNEEAVDVTIFSLYITLFDYQNAKSIKDYRLPLLKSSNIVFGDFFAESDIKEIQSKSFDYILGNPPWGKVKQERYKEYCKEHAIIPQDGEICVAFMLKVMDIAGENTECSLVVPSKILYKRKSPSVRFRRLVLENTQINQVLELSAVRKQIFKDAIAPAAVISFIRKKAEVGHKIEYISIKPNIYLKTFGIIMIEPDDVKYVSQKLLLENDNLWKILVYGGYWDFELISSLKGKYDTFGQVVEDYGFMMKKGLQDNPGEQDSSHLIGRPILKSDKVIEQFVLDDTLTEVFDKERIHRPRNEKIYHAPYVLFKKGLSCKDFSIRAAYSEKDFLYKETISCIKGDASNKNILLNICGLLNSSLFSYFNLMFCSSTGIEREQIFLDELADYPYLYSDELVRLVERIIHEDNKVERNQLKKRIDQCVLQMYGLNDNPFINYAINVQIPLLCGQYKDKKCDAKILKNYAHIFEEIWHEQFGESGVNCSFNLYPNIKDKYAAMQVQLSVDEIDCSIDIIENSNDIEELTNFMIYKFNDSFFQEKNVFEFSENAFVIVKPISEKNWHSAMAIQDSYKVMNAILLDEEVCE